MSANRPYSSRFEPKGRSTYQLRNRNVVVQGPEKISNNSSTEEEEENILYESAEIQNTSSSSQSVHEDNDYSQVSEDEKIEELQPKTPPPKPAVDIVQQPKIEAKNKFTFDSSKCFYISFFIGIIAASTYGFFKTPAPPPKTCDAFKQFHHKYPHNDKLLWKSLQVGIDNAIYKNPGVPSTFIFMHNSTQNSSHFIQDMVKTSIGCMGENVKPIILQSDDLKSDDLMEDYGHFIVKYREDLEENGLLVVHNLNDVPGEVAQAFHAFCDIYDPVVEKAIFFFTVDIRNPPSLSDFENPLRMAEIYLKHSWKQQLASNILDPLITRLTENVFLIK